jgi:hypothetical protein
MDENEATLERFRLTELIGRYVDALNHRDWESYADCWTEDCIFKMTIANDDAPASDKMTTIARPISVRTDGREGILGLVRNYNNYPWLFQLPIGVIVELEGAERARIRHLLRVESHALLLIGHCYDIAIKSGDGKWRLAHRDYMPSYWEAREAPGAVCRSLPDPDYRMRP